LADPRAPKLILVASTAEDELAPRAARVQALVPELQASWDVEVIPGPWTGRPPQTRMERATARLERRLARHIALDEYELWSLRRFGLWRPRAELALLMAWPYSASVIAARRLARAGVPYVVDAGDPWVLTARGRRPAGLANRRRRAAERGLWSRAAGAILTTRRQETALRDIFPALRTIVQPNGSRPLPGQAARRSRRWAAGEPLELGHFGVLYSERIDFIPVLAGILEEGPWHEIVLHQFGAISLAPGGVPEGLSIRAHDPVPWSEAARWAERLHALVVVGNTNPAQLPSKTIDYGALPAPRMALVADARDDAIVDHVAGRPDWLVIGASERLEPAAVADHVTRAWSAEELAPPEEDSWAVAGPRIRRFLEELAASRPRHEAT
jgi:hypothetical protein